MTNVGGLDAPSRRAEFQTVESVGAAGRREACCSSPEEVGGLGGRGEELAVGQLVSHPHGSIDEALRMASGEGDRNCVSRLGALEVRPLVAAGEQAVAHGDVHDGRAVTRRDVYARP